MKFITGQDRNQIPLFASSLEAAIDQDNEVRLINMFVDSLKMADYGFKVTNQNDNKAMGGIVRRAKTILQNNDFTALYDKGYHTGGEFDYADKQVVEVIVAIPDPASHAPDPAFDVEHFEYDKLSDSYTCPCRTGTHHQW